jgi:CheY-like chemotaxis protein
MNKFILIDDDEMINFIHRQVILSVDPSAEVIVILSAEEGLQKMKELATLEKSDPLILFVDINMPEINGFELLSRLETEISNLNKIQLYMVSSSLFESDREKAMAFPFVKGYREKPLGKEIIKEILDNNA